jgi:hypothetical protein
MTRMSGGRVKTLLLSPAADVARALRQLGAEEDPFFHPGLSGTGLVPVLPPPSGTAPVTDRSSTDRPRPVGSSACCDTGVICGSGSLTPSPKGAMAPSPLGWRRGQAVKSLCRRVCWTISTRSGRSIPRPGRICRPRPSSFVSPMGDRRAGAARTYRIAY